MARGGSACQAFIKAFCSGLSRVEMDICDDKIAQTLLGMIAPYPKAMARPVGIHDKMTAIGFAYIDFDGYGPLNIGECQRRKSGRCGGQYDCQCCRLWRPKRGCLASGKIRVEGEKATPIDRRPVSGFVGDALRLCQCRCNAGGNLDCDAEIPVRNRRGHGNRTMSRNSGNASVDFH